MSNCIGNNINKFRAAKSISQKELASLINSTQQSIGRWEKGTAEPPATALKKLALALGVPVDALLREDKKNQYDDVDKYRSAMGGEHHNVPWGTATLSFHGLKEQLDFPIDHWNLYCIQDELIDSRAMNRNCFTFESLDNQLVLINFSALNGINLVNDHIEAMPNFYSDLAYRLIDEGSFDKLLEVEPDAHQHAIDNGLGTLLKVLFTDGSESTINLPLDSDKIYVEFERVLGQYYQPNKEMNYTSEPPKAIIKIVEEEDGEISLINLERVAMLSFPLRPMLRNAYDTDITALDDIELEDND